MTTKYIVNNVTGQTITGNLTINGNLTITGTTNTRPYKVYTALLSQNGGDDIGYLQNGELTVGMTYKINFNSDGMDFTNVGAPNNKEGTYFVATGAEPFGWGESIGTENILEYNLGAPIVTRILDNTLEDTVYYTYLQGGFYSLYSDSFIQNKTFIIINGWGDDGFSPKQISAIDLYGDKIPQIKIASTTDSDNWFKIYLEIRVYN